MNDRLEWMSSQTRQVKVRIKLFIKFPNNASETNKQKTYCGKWEVESWGNEMVSAFPIQQHDEKKQERKKEMEDGIYMLSPLIMYKPNTSCCTPSCKINRANY